jgi:transcriptional regulator with AAA-type ATPase domain
MSNHSKNNIVISKKNPESHSKKIKRNNIHPLWFSFIDYCETLGYGEILRLKIHDGLPALAEEVRLRTSFLNLRREGQKKEEQSNENRSQRLQIIKNFENLDIQTLKKFHPDFLHDWEKTIIEREVIGLFIESYFVEKSASLKKFMFNLEKTILKKVLAKVNGNQKEASRLLGLNNQTLNSKVKKYDISINKDPK